MSALTPDDFKLLYRVRSQKAWEEACRTIKERHGGEYPEDWLKNVNESGVMAAIMRRVDAKAAKPSATIGSKLARVRELLKVDDEWRAGHSTPWGKALAVTKVADGIWYVEAEHKKGYKLDAARNKQIAQAIKDGAQDPLVHRGWYQSDFNAAAVEFTFPEHFKSNGLVGDYWITQSVAFCQLGLPPASKKSLTTQAKLWMDLKARRREAGKDPAEGFSTGAFGLHRVPEAGMLTPWGTARDVEKVADGIWRVATAEDAGYFVDAALNACVPETFKSGSLDKLSTECGWYNARSDAAIVEYAFAEHFEKSGAERLEWVAQRMSVIKEKDVLDRSAGNVLRELMQQRKERQR